MVVLIPRAGVAGEDTAALASALGGVRFVVVERSPGAAGVPARGDDSWDQPSAEAGAEADVVARQLARGVRPDRLVVVGQGDGASVAVELARRLEGISRTRAWVRAVVVAAATPSRADGPGQVEPIAAPIHVWAGSGDPFAPPGHGMLGWREHTEASATFRQFDGADDFLLTRAQEVARRLRQLLAAHDEAEVLDAR